MQAPRGAFLLKAPTSFRRRITIADDIHHRRATMIIGTPREIKNHEYRVGLTPESARELVVHGHRVLVQTGAGEGIGAHDRFYVEAGAAIVQTAEAISEQSDMVVKGKIGRAARREQVDQYVR